MIRVVIDTNVIASGLIKSQSTPGRILDCWAAGLFELVTSEHILGELEHTLTKPYFQRFATTDWATSNLSRLRQFSSVTNLAITISAIASHPEDGLVIATAVNGNASILVTGDKQLLSIGRYQTIPFLAPATFLEMLLEGIETAPIW